MSACVEAASVRARRALTCGIFAWGVLGLALPALASAQQTVFALGTCGFSGTRVTLNGNGFQAGETVVVEMMSTADPLAGRPISARRATADPAGGLTAALDVPPVDGTDPVERSVRVRPVPDPGPGIPAVLATARIRTANRATLISPQRGEGKAHDTTRWQAIGLPEGLELWAHYRHRGQTVARTALGTVRGGCGELDVALRNLPRNRARPGAWDVWITADSTFRVPRAGVYLQRHMTVAGDGPDATVRFAALRSRLVPVDARVSAPPTNLFLAYASPIGLIRLVMGGALGRPVRFFERIGDRVKPLGMASALPGTGTNLLNATTWSCTHRTRRFVGTTTLPDGSPALGVGVVKTPSCATRFSVRAPLRVQPGQPFEVRVTDRWGNGAVTPTLCVTPPARRRSCRDLKFPKAIAITTRKFRAGKRGSWRVDLRIEGSHTRSTVGVGERSAATKAEPRLLATGDSMMLGIDSSLVDELLGTASVHSDVILGSGISDGRSDWPAIAARQVRTVKPKVTVIMIGANDGFPMDTPAGARVVCCDAPWASEYARRLSAMMRSYVHNGRARVLWLTLPLPRSDARAAITKVVNFAVLQAAAGVAGVTVVRLDQVFTPAGYTEVYRYNGRNVRVREFDGVHLNVQGQAIAGEIVAKLVRGAR